jgi:hypothetical protein
VAGVDDEGDTEVTRVLGAGDWVGGRAAEGVAETVLLAAQRRWMGGCNCALVVERKKVESAKRSVVDFMAAGS